MIAFLLNLILALLWAALVGSVGSVDLLVGFVLGYAILWFCKPLLGDSRYFEKLPLLLRFAAFLAAEVVLSSLRVAWDVVRPGARYRPGVVAVPLEAASDVEITVVANLITLTPGTLSLDVSPDRSTLYVHAMSVDDPAALRRELKIGFERRVLELLR